MVSFNAAQVRRYGVNKPSVCWIHNLGQVLFSFMFPSKYYPVLPSWTTAKWIIVFLIALCRFNLTVNPFPCSLTWVACNSEWSLAFTKQQKSHQWVHTNTNLSISTERCKLIKIEFFRSKSAPGLQEDERELTKMFKSDFHYGKPVIKFLPHISYFSF